MNWIVGWVDNESRIANQGAPETGIDWQRVWPFFLIHVACLGVVVVGWSPIAVTVALLAYVVRMFAITAFFHRYFSHKSFKTYRSVQFAFALLGTASTQRGPLWWAAHHRHHHRHSDREGDVHSPLNGFFQSHCGWFLGKENFPTQKHLIKDFAKYPELRWLDRFDTVVPLAMAMGMWLLGEVISWQSPGSGTSGWQMLVWGYFISTVLLIHATLAINSFAHRFGTRRYRTADRSRNNFLLALITMGEGWHNNHHHYAGSARQGFFWWEIDLSFYGLKAMEKLGLVWDLRPVPEHKKWGDLLNNDSLPHEQVTPSKGRKV